MDQAREDEQIIELTEVVAEPPVLPKEPAGKSTGSLPVEPWRSRLKPQEQQEEHRSEEVPPAGISGQLPAFKQAEPSQRVLPATEAQVEALEEAIKARAAEWVASEGPKVLEKVAREIFPRIAQEVLRREIDKLKAEVGVEEKE